MSERAGVRSFTTICLPSRARVPPASPSANRPFLDDAKTLRQRTGDGDVLDSSRPSREDFTMISEWSARFGTPPSAISFPAKCVGRVCVSRMRCGCGARVSCVQRACGGGRGALRVRPMCVRVRRRSSTYGGH